MSKLNGMHEIIRFTGLSESTIILKVQQEDFPAEKTKEGTWISDKKKINKWLMGQKEKQKVIEKYSKMTSYSANIEGETEEKKKPGRPPKNEK